MYEERLSFQRSFLAFFREKNKLFRLSSFVLAFLLIPQIQGCGRIWGTVTWYNNNSALSYAFCSQSAVLAVGAPGNITPTIVQGAGPFIISPNLPSGLSLNPVTGIISGTPTTVSGPTTYTLSSGGILLATISLQTVQGYVVNSLGDATDFNPGDGICSTTASPTGPCTLRAALVEANADGAGPYNVALPAGTITVGSSLPVSTNINIYGLCPGLSIVDGGGSFTIFQSSSANKTFNLTSLRLQNGFAAASNGVWSTGFNANDTLTCLYDYFYNNIGTFGGALSIWNGTFNCDQCVFDSNNDTAGRGVIFGGNAINITRSLFVDNYSTAIWVLGGPNFISNSTFYNNAGGPAIALNTGGGLTLTNNTFINNVEAVGPGSAGTPATLANNLFFNNTTQCGGLTFTSSGGNLVYPNDGTCNTTQPTDIALAPTLGPIQNNGGFSSTVALLPGSAGIDAAVVGNCPATDQRAYPRLVDGMCDIGAYESAP
jgi:CSLREA domain-containing protein